ncbi:MAG TPA: DUF3526 domain-containing protein [Candidatus Obscuribacterales bacterium]
MRGASWRIVALQELRMLARSRRFRLLMVLSTLLFGLALLTGWQHARDYREAFSSVMGRQQDMWERQGELNPHSASHQGLYAFKPWNPLSAWDPGLLPYLGSAVFLEPHKQNFDRYRAAQDQLRLSRFAPITLATLFQYLVPLLVILLAYAMIAQERENGTLKLLLVQGSTPIQLFVGKAAALGLAMSALLLPLAALSLLLMALSGPLPWSRLLFFGLAYGLYWLIFIWLGLLVSALASSSRTALLLLLGLWFLNALIVPRIGLGWMQARHPLPTAGEFQQQIAKAQEALPDWETRTETVKARLFKQYGVSEVKALPVNLEGAVLQDNERDDSRVHAEHFERLYQRYRKDAASYRGLGWLFPGVAIQTFSQSLAGSDFAHHHHFLAASEHYRFEYVTFLNDAIVKAADKVAFEYTAGNELWKQVPDFHYQSPPLTQVLAENVPSLAALALWVLALLGLTPLLLKRMQVVA